MSTAGEVILGVLMAIGLVGVLVPMLPGLLLIAAVAIGWAIAEGGTGAWAATAVILAILAAGTIVKYLLPGRELRAQRVPPLTWALAVILGVVGFFVIPVIGAAIGFVLGVYLGERERFGAHAPAWESSKRLIVSIGIGMAVEFAAGVLAIAVWIAAVIAT